MARKFPAFFYYNPQNTKSKGHFVAHLLYPKFVAQIEKPGTNPKIIFVEFLEDDPESIPIEKTNLALKKMNKFARSLETGERHS
jgi:hypothetical protein